MAKKPSSLWDYVREAFNAKPRVPGLGDVPANWLFVLATGVLGLVNPGVWLLGAGVELAYLTVLSHNERFRKFVDASATGRSAVDWMQRKLAVVQQLDEPFGAVDEITRSRLCDDLQHLFVNDKFAGLLVTHSISEAVYLGDRVWIFTPAPGRIAVEIRDCIPPARGTDPLEAQEQGDFKEGMMVVAREFTRVTEPS